MLYFCVAPRSPRRGVGAADKHGKHAHTFATHFSLMVDDMAQSTWELRVASGEAAAKIIFSQLDR